MTTTELIATADRRILTIAERAELTAGLWKGTASDFRRLANQAYAVAKKYDAIGGGDLLDEMQAAFDRLGSSDFRVLYAAAKLVK